MNMRDIINKINKITEEIDISNFEKEMDLIDQNPLIRKSGTNQFYVVQDALNPDAAFMDVVFRGDATSIFNVAAGTMDKNRGNPEIYSLEQRQQAMSDAIYRLKSINAITN